MKHLVSATALAAALAGCAPVDALGGPPPAPDDAPVKKAELAVVEV